MTNAAVITHNGSWCSLITRTILLVWIPQVANMTTANASACLCSLLWHGSFIATKRPTFRPHPSPKRLFLITATADSTHGIWRLLQVIRALCCRRCHSIKRIVVNTGETIKVASGRFVSRCQTRRWWRRVVVAAADVRIHLLETKMSLLFNFQVK